MNYIPSHEILKNHIGIDLVGYFVAGLDKDLEICLFGFGGDGKAIYKRLNEIGRDVRCICDNNWRSINDAKVISPESAVKNNPDALFVVSSHLYSCEMELQLIELGVLEDRIVSFDESVEMVYRGMLPEYAYGDMVSAIHYETVGIYPDLANPKTFNEKMMVSMIALPQEMKTVLTDKFKVRFWVAEKIGKEYLIPLIGHWESVNDVMWKALPSKYALKLNHGCGLNIISDGRNEVNIGLAQRKLKSWVKCNHGYITYERHYVPIKPHIICEQYVENIDNDVYDYKVFCFHGEPKYIMVLSQRKKGLKMVFLDLNWNVVPFVYSFPRADSIPPKPKKLGELLELTRVLCKDFDHVRVDWYILNDGTIKFGEMTFTSAGGHAKWDPCEWDLILGEMW